MRVEAAKRTSWEEALQGLAFDSNRCPRPGEQLLALLRAGHYLGHMESEEELLQSVLNDAVGVLDAQRGAIALAEGEQGPLRLRALATGRAAPRCCRRPCRVGESNLFQPEPGPALLWPG